MIEVAEWMIIVIWCITATFWIVQNFWAGVLMFSLVATLFSQMIKTSFLREDIIKLKKKRGK